MADKTLKRLSQDKKNSIISQTILETSDETASHTYSDDVPEIDLDNPVNFERREPYKSPRSPTIDAELQKETLDLVISTLNESGNHGDQPEMNNNQTADKR